jgi:hypothetical protein
MDIEQLKLILETMSNAGEGAWWIALVWVVKPYFIAMIWATTVLVLVWILSRLAYRILHVEAFTRKVAVETGVVLATDVPNKYEEERILNTMRRWKKSIDA